MLASILFKKNPEVTVATLEATLDRLFAQDERYHQWLSSPEKVAFDAWQPPLPDEPFDPLMDRPPGIPADAHELTSAERERMKDIERRICTFKMDEKRMLERIEPIFNLIVQSVDDNINREIETMPGSQSLLARLHRAVALINRHAAVSPSKTAAKLMDDLAKLQRPNDLVQLGIWVDNVTFLFGDMRDLQVIVQSVPDLVAMRAQPGHLIYLPAPRITSDSDIYNMLMVIIDGNPPAFIQVLLGMQQQQFSPNNCAWEIVSGLIREVISRHVSIPVVPIPAPARTAFTAAVDPHASGTALAMANDLYARIAQLEHQLAEQQQAADCHYPQQQQQQQQYPPDYSPQVMPAVPPAVGTAFFGQPSFPGGGGYPPPGYFPGYGGGYYPQHQQMMHPYPYPADAEAFAAVASKRPRIAGVYNPAGTGPASGVCFAFQRTGQCMRGASCKFSHDTGAYGGGGVGRGDGGATAPGSGRDGGGPGGSGGGGRGSGPALAGAGLPST
jgi:hypothetical protein